jgi:hypothetical protein
MLGFAFHHHVQKSPFRQPLFWSTRRRPGVPIDQLKMARAEGSAGHSYLYRNEPVGAGGREAQDTYNWRYLSAGNVKKTS